MTTPSVRDMEEARKIVAEFHARGNTGLTQLEHDFAQALARAREEGRSGMLKDFWIYGSDGCRNCETGRITLYAKSGWCIECTSRARGSHE